MHSSPSNSSCALLPPLSHMTQSSIFIVKADADVNGTGCNWEVMTVKLALEKWGNWLEGAVVD